MISRALLTRFGIGCLLWSVVTTAECVADERLSYNRDVRPILADKCFSCHGADSAARKADLRLDQRDAAIASEAIQPGDLLASQMIVRIVTDDEDSIMPPRELKKPLSVSEIETLKQWVAQGAEYQAHWSFLAPQRPELPLVTNRSWEKSPIDRFILNQLEAKGLSPADEAAPHQFFRRLHLDITGLPPKPEMVSKFVADYQLSGDAALKQWIDQLMAQPSWGEHRARYWLGAARYGDTHGLHFDNYREMWPYRDWVVRSFNANQRFDQFTVEQLAGDLLEKPSRDQLIATGFQRCNITTNEGGTIDEENLALYAADRVQTLGWVYMGLTTNCAQCHDHKFDPIGMKDYYALAAFFRNTTQGAKDGNVADGNGPVIRVPAPADQARYEELPQLIVAAKSALDQRKSQAAAEHQQWLDHVTPNSFADQPSTERLILHAPLTEGAEGVSLNLITGNPLKAIGQISWSDEGKLGKAPRFQSGQTFEVGELGDFERDQPFTVAAWVRAEKDGGNGSVVARMDVANGFRGWDLWTENRTVGIHLVDAWPDSALKVVTEKPVLKKGEWQHLVISYDGSSKPSSVKIFVDGQSQRLRTGSDNLKPDASIRAKTPLRIGQRSMEQVFEGSVQDVRLYGRVLDADEARFLATIEPVRYALKIPSQQRSAKEQELLLQYFLNHADSSYQQLQRELLALEGELAEIEKRSAVTHVQREKENSPAMANLLMRGEYDKVGDPVQANTPAALPPMGEGLPRNRLGLARWMVDSNNPLTARVIVNRFWLQLFGQGIVATPEDFGVSGAMPSHPELLDWLAVEFQESGWDVQHLFRLILSSAAYRQSAQVTVEKLEKDRDNSLLSRGPRFRMDAEMIRDHALAVSGILAPKMGGPPVKPYQPEGIWDVVGLPEGNTRNYVPGTGEDLYRRSLYTFWKRMAPPPNMEVFNAPSREVCSVKRERTNTPLQALVTLNDPQFVEAARVLATNCIHEVQGNQFQSIAPEPVAGAMAQRVLGRSLSIGEQAIIVSNLEKLLDHYSQHPEAAAQLVQVGQFKVDSTIAPVQLAAWTLIGNQLLNLDETLNK